MSSSLTDRLPVIAPSRADGHTAQPKSVQVCQLTDLTDENLIELLCKGDTEAMALLLRRYAGIVRGIAYRVLRDPSEADDLLQDIFVLIHRLCKTFDPSRGSARFWILQMTQHRAISRRRYLITRHFYKRLDLDDTVVQSNTATGSAYMPDEALESRETLCNWFEQLSPNQQETLRLFFFEGCTFQEIAASLGQTAGNARHHYYRGLDRLRKLIFSGKLPRIEGL